MTQYSIAGEYQHLQCDWRKQLSCHLSDDRI